MRNLKHYLLSTGVLLAGSVFCADTSYAATVAYGYAQQSLTGVAVTGAGIFNASQTGSSNTASAVINGLGVSSNDTTDTPQAYVGAPPAALQNTFNKYSAQGGGPQPLDFTRGDGLLGNTDSLFSSGAWASVVSESVTNSPANGLETGQSTFTISGSFQNNNALGTTVRISYNFANDIITLVGDPASSAQAQFSASISIKDQHGNEVKSTPVELASTLSAPPNSPEVINSGSGSVNLDISGLTPGDNLSLTITGNSSTSATVPDLTATPEPASLGLIGAGIVALALRRRS